MTRHSWLKPTTDCTAGGLITPDVIERTSIKKPGVGMDSLVRYRRSGSDKKSLYSGDIY